MIILRDLWCKRIKVLVVLTKFNKLSIVKDLDVTQLRNNLWRIVVSRVMNGSADENMQMLNTMVNNLKPYYITFENLIVNKDLMKERRCRVGVVRDKENDFKNMNLLLGKSGSREIKNNFWITRMSINIHFILFYLFLSFVNFPCRFQFALWILHGRFPITFH